jgi:drug/metabolite transporter (DMT)-like permease
LAQTACWSFSAALVTTRASGVLPSSRVPSFAQIPPAVFSVTAVFVWGLSDFAGGYASRRANAFVLTAFSHICAFVLMFAVAITQRGAFPSRASILWALLAGLLGGFSLALFYRALASGQMGLTAPIAALIGAAVPTLADVAMEGTPRPWTILGFALAIVAIWLITRPESREPGCREPGCREEDPRSNNDDTGHPRGVALAALAGVGFAGFYLCIHQASGSPTWLAAISRIGSFTSTAVAVIAIRAPLSLNRTSLALGAFAGCFDILGSALFIFASEHGRLDEAVVITSLYPAFTVLLARIILKEHFSRWKFIGLLAALAAVPLIAGG